MCRLAVVGFGGRLGGAPWVLLVEPWLCQIFYDGTYLLVHGFELVLLFCAAPLFGSQRILERLKCAQGGFQFGRPSCGDDSMA